MREIPGYLGYYATEDGNIISFRSGYPRELTKQIHKNYYHVFVRKGFGRKTQVKMPVHQLVLMAYKGVKPDPIMLTRHLNGNCLDNCPDNLEWGTVKENVQDSIRHGTAACLRLGEQHPCSKLREQDIRDIKAALAKGINQYIIAKQYNISQRHVSDIKLEKTWKHLATQGV